MPRPALDTPDSSAPRSLRIGLLAGEPSGDALGAGLMRALSEQRSVQPEFFGVGGSLMMAEGLKPLADIDRLGVNGFVEPIKRLPDLVRLLRQLTRDFAALDLDAFVGVDFNVFNFLLEGALSKRGLKTVHYVSPSVYAWRRGRAKRVAKVADMILCLYPFEPAFYDGLPVEPVFVGHPLADRIAPDADTDALRRTARDTLGVAQDAVVLAVLPGSRSSEVKLHATDFLDAAARFADPLKREGRSVEVVIPCPRAHLVPLIEAARGAHHNVRVLNETATRSLTACDVALVKSGTATLETMLLHRPMVVSYRLGALSYQLAKRLLRTPYVALPNILSDAMLVPELLQDQGTPEALGEALLNQWQRGGRDSALTDQFISLHRTLRRDADASAASAVLRLCRG